MNIYVYLFLNAFLMLMKVSLSPRVLPNGTQAITKVTHAVTQTYRIKLAWVPLRSAHTLKTPGSDLTRKRVPWGQTHSWVRLIWNPGKNYRNLSPKCVSDSDSGSV